MAERSGAVPRKPRNPADAPSPRWEVGLGAFATASVDAFMLFDENLNVVGVNPAAERLAEPSRPPTGAPIGKSILDLSPEIKDSLRYDEYLRVMETGEPYYAEVVSHHPELGEKHHSIKAFKVGDGLGLIVSDITERKQAEEALRESEERLRTLFETMAEGVIAIAPHGRIVDANPAAERILGLKRSEIEGRNYIAPEWEVFRPDGTPMPPEEMAGPRAMKEKRPVRDTVMGVKRPDGSVSWLNVSAAPLLDSLGELTGVVGTFGDITERKQAEEALRDSEEKYRGMFENMLDGFAYHRIVLDEAGKPVDYVFLELNNRFEECTGLKRDDIIGRGVTEVIPGIRDADPDLIGIYGKVALTEEPVQFSIYFAPFDKHYSISAYCPRQGYFVALFHDITDRKRAEEALKKRDKDIEEQNIFLESIFDGVASAIFVVDVAEDGDFRYSANNASHQRAMGFEPGEIIGKTPEDLVPLIPPVTVTAVLANYQRCLDEGRAIQYDEMMEIGGRPIWVFTTLVPLQNSEEIGRAHV